MSRSANYVVTQHCREEERLASSINNRGRNCTCLSHTTLPILFARALCVWPSHLSSLRSLPKLARPERDPGPDLPLGGSFWAPGSSWLLSQTSAHTRSRAQGWGLVPGLGIPSGDDSSSESESISEVLGRPIPSPSFAVCVLLERSSLT